MAEITWGELRKEYPFVPYHFWVEKIRETKLEQLDDEGLEILCFILAEENEKGIKAKEAEQKLIREKLNLITASMVHNDFDIKVPLEIDKLHCQAYIVYGLLAPSQTRTFAGSRSRTLQPIRQFVSNKLGLLFDCQKFNNVHNWLLKNGVILSKKGISLNTKLENCTPEGRAIVKEAERFKMKFTKK